MKKILFIALFCFTFFPLVSFAHPGRTDSLGCHTCKTNCPNWGLTYGEYHCHRSKDTVQPKKPIRSTHGDDGTGYTSPASEYKTPKVAEIIKVNTQAKNTEKGGWFSRLFSWFK